MRALQRKPRKYEVLSEESKGFFGKALEGRASGMAKTTKQQVLSWCFILFILDIPPALSDHLLSSLPNSGSRLLWILKAVPRTYIPGGGCLETQLGMLSLVTWLCCADSCSESPPASIAEMGHQPSLPPERPQNEGLLSGITKLYCWGTLKITPVL